MALWKHWCAVLAYIYLLMSCSQADFIVEVEFFTYVNPFHAALAFNGACCDHSSNLFPPNCTNNCDNYFFICLRDTNDTREVYVSEDLVTTTANESCPYGWIITDELTDRNDDELSFTRGSLDRSQQTPNPVVLESSNPWPGIAELVIVVIDNDGGRDDIVDIVSVSVSTDPSAIGVIPTSGDIAYYGGRALISFIELGYVFNCSRNFYGSACSTFCEPRNDTFGHFTCNETSGSIICNEGYTNTSIWCTECIPADTCSLIGGFCVEPGDCICLEGYVGENCSELFQQTTTLTGSGRSLGPPIGGTITGILILLAIGAVVAIAIIGEKRKRKTKRANAKKKLRSRNSEMLSNAAYIKTRIQIQDSTEMPTDKRHEEFETSHNPGYRVISLARQQAANLTSSYPGALHPSHHVGSTTPTNYQQQEDLYYYSYPNSSQRLIQMNQQGVGVGIYSLEGPHSGDEESVGGHDRDFKMDRQENEYTYVATEYVNGYSLSPQGSKSQLQRVSDPPAVTKKTKPMPLPRTKKTSVPESEPSYI